MKFQFTKRFTKIALAATVGLTALVGGAHAMTEVNQCKDWAGDYHTAVWAFDDSKDEMIKTMDRVMDNPFRALVMAGDMIRQRDAFDELNDEVGEERYSTYLACESDVTGPKNPLARLLLRGELETLERYDGYYDDMLEEFNTKAEEFRNN